MLDEVVPEGCVMKSSDQPPTTPRPTDPGRAASPARDGAPQPGLLRTGGFWFLLTAAFGRLPAAMIQLGILLYVTRAGAGLAVAGLAVAALGIGTAIGAPLVGRLVDRYGPLPVLLGATAVQLGSLLALVRVDVSVLAALFGLSVLLGAANPQVAAIARSRWTRLARYADTRPDLESGDRLVRRALGYESAMDEVSFVLGPALGGVLIGALGARPGLLVIAALTLVGQGAFALFLLREPPSALGGVTGRGPIPWLVMLAPLLAAGAVGIGFGSLQTGLAAHFDVVGRPGLTGPVYAVVGLGSGIASLLTGRLPGPVWPRLPLGGAILVGGALLMRATVDHLPLLVLGALLAGLGIGPILVSAFTLVERFAPRSSLTTAMTAMATATVLGVSFGAAVGGRVAEPLLLAVAAGVLAGILGVPAARARVPTDPVPTEPVPTEP